MKQQITRKNHYVPQWYQRGFLDAPEHKLHVLNLAPEQRTLPNGRVVVDAPLKPSAPVGIFWEYDLYTTRFGEALNDEIERLLFGAIDNDGARAVRAFANNDALAIHETFLTFFRYLDAQKLRTPKGLDWIVKRYAGMSQLALMQEMQSLRLMHCTMWMECVREIVSAEKSSVKFLISDHPVTIYHREHPPDAAECCYPQDPAIELIGSQTVFALDANHCLILTNLEYAEDPGGSAVMGDRTHARYRGRSLARTDAFIRGREFTSDQVMAVNHLLKSRARKYVAAGRPDWLYPERVRTFDWREVGELLLPRDDLWKFGGEIIIGYKDGRTHYQDQFGRSSRIHKFLRKDPPTSELKAEDLCGCGSGHQYQNCCRDIPPQRRPSWTTYSIRERNLILCQGVQRILRINEGATWDAVRRELSGEQVRQIHDLYARWWPLDTQLADLLPRPRANVLRAVFMGVPDARMLSLTVTGWLSYFDEVVLAHPFLNSATIKPEFSPSAAPSGFKEQTLRNVYVLLMLEPYIASGRVHLVPDPADFDVAYMQEVLAIADGRKDGVNFSARDRKLIQQLTADDYQRSLKRLPDDALASYIKGKAPEIANEALQDLVADWKRELEDDPLALLQPFVPGEEGAQARTIKGFNLETSMFIASLTGAVLYADMDATWDQLHQPDYDQPVTPAAEWESDLRRFADIDFPLYLEDEGDSTQANLIGVLRDLLRVVLNEAKCGRQPPSAHLRSLIDEALKVSASYRPDESSSTAVDAWLRVSVPAGGFRRKHVTRLLLTFGRVKDVESVPLAFLLHWSRTRSARREAAE
jgi:hypothetical protein